MKSAISATPGKPRLTTSAIIASIAGEGQKTKPAPFGHALVELARSRPEVVGLTADLGKYTDLHIFAKQFPDGYGGTAPVRRGVGLGGGRFHALCDDLCGVRVATSLRFYSPDDRRRGPQREDRVRVARPHLRLRPPLAISTS
jgi:hypothetical protein